MPDKRLLHEKLAEILNQLGNLRELIKLPSKKLLGDEHNFYFAQRVMERMIGAAIDINMHVISDSTGKVPDDYFSSFTELASARVLPKTFSKQIARSVFLRNILVHEYQKLDDDKFYAALKIGLTDYSIYARHIKKYLETL